MKQANNKQGLFHYLQRFLLYFSNTHHLSPRKWIKLFFHRTLINLQKDASEINTIQKKVRCPPNTT
jgi:hypothetical protein